MTDAALRSTDISEGVVPTWHGVRLKMAVLVTPSRNVGVNQVAESWRGARQ